MTETAHPTVRVRCDDASDRFVASALVRTFAASLGLSRRACQELAIAAAELASNAVRHGGGGVLEARLVHRGERRALELECRDRGDGIADPSAAMRDGWSRGRELTPDDAWGGGLGRGLGAVSRAVDELEFARDGERGHVVLARRWIRAALAPRA